MSAKVLPFYQKKQKHFDLDYRNTQARYAIQEYTAARAAQRSAVRTSSTSASPQFVPHAERFRTSAADEQLQYTVPPFRKRTEGPSEGASRSVRFSSQLAQIEEEIQRARSAAREHLDRVTIQRMVEERAALERHIHEESMIRSPDILVRLRSHTVWERTPVKFFFTVQGYPDPIVKWYKNDVLITAASEPGKYHFTNKYGVHSLEINRCDIHDTATYTAVAVNVHGQAATNAALIVKRYRGEEEPYHSVLLPLRLPALPDIVFTHIDVQFLEKFDVSFGTEGDTLTLSCLLLVTPDLTRLKPQAQWFRDDVLIEESKWAKMSFEEGRATINMPHLNKDDEGLYTLRMVTRGGVNQHSAYVFVRDAAAPVVGAPGAPMDIACYDANRDYVIVTWKPPNTASESPVIGYFVDRCEVGAENWIQCNDAPVKICKYPVTGLHEGHSYVFRVRAVNKSGISKPSRISNQVAALDPADLDRLHTIHLEGGKKLVICEDDLEGEVKVPGSPTNVYASETSKTYVVLSWEPPVPRGREPLMYYIEKSLAGSTGWQRVNPEVAIRSPRYAVFDLAEGKSYSFRVLSVNKYGVSDPSVPTKPVQAAERIGVPSAPGRVLATRNAKTSVVVQWEKPKLGEELLGYYIDSSIVGSNHWEPCNHRPIKYTRFVVHGLTTGEKYLFRVKAVNAVGVSENSQESEAIIVQPALTSPSHPYGITLLNCDGHSMTIGWKLPRFTGGSDITGYYIDKRLKDEILWEEVNPKPVTLRVHKVENLKEGSSYEFKICAANIAGLGLPSDPSDFFKCEAWTMAEPGPAYDLTFLEVRNTSLVILWKAPIYTGSSPISGYFVDYQELDAQEWVTVSQKTTPNRYLKVNGLEEGKTYVFRVRSVNAAGPGRASDVSEPVLVKVRPGTKDISSGVDEEGNIFLAFECKDMTDASSFIWNKSYEEITDTNKYGVETVGPVSKLYFKDPDKNDLGNYSVVVTDTDGISSSYSLEPDELERLMALRHEIRHPTIPLKYELSYEIFEKGQIRFWLQAEKLSPSAEYHFIINDKEVKNSETHKIKCNVPDGIIEMWMDRFTIENEGTYTVQIQDGKAKNQSSLVLIGDAFKAALAEAEFQRREYLRKQGPHFLEYLRWFVTEDCNVMFDCKVANTKKESVFKWLKDDAVVVPEEPPNLQTGVCHLLITEFSKKDQGEYKAKVSDDRGQDVSTLDVSGKVYENIILELSRVSGSSASDLKVHCTPDGIRLQCFLKYFLEDMKVAWYHKESKISSTDRTRIGGTSDQAWMQICGPTDKDKGKYTFEIFDAKQSYKRTIDLSGQAFDEAFAEYQRLKQAAFAEKNRGKVVGGLPDVVTIMEGKTLSLTCTVCGDPAPDVVWFKNDKELELNDHYRVSLEQGKFASLTIIGVCSEDSGRYGINVKNKHGGETVDVTVSVYKHGEELPPAKLPPSHKPAPVDPAPAAPAPAAQPQVQPMKKEPTTRYGRPSRK
ncbi:myomesin-2 [Protopterus annectens]|uniref:myomesin-2 n=1 Tax=Protopterus annectens TaxID=7888 RepID=UPI001CFBDC70|nr:myomesin-2 [Protopterus annectens]